MEPIFAPATALVASAIGVVRTSGTNLRARLQGWVKLPPPRRASVRRLRWEGYDERALVLFFPAPDSFTGEDVVEFHLHGNPRLVHRVMDHLKQLGFRLAEPGEFTRRALWNGRVGLLEAEAYRDLINASTDLQIRQAQARCGGEPEWIARAREALRPWIAQAEASVDYGEDEDLELDLPYMQSALASLRTLFHVEHQRAAAAGWLRDGIRVALVGCPNAGKSTLFNAMAGEDRAIVTELPGTTRDVLDVTVEWGGLPLRLFDTAGLRDAEDRVEQLGVARVEAVLQQADVILHLVPVAGDSEDQYLAIALAPYAAKVLQVWTMVDCGEPPVADGIAISALTGNLEPLARALRDRFLGGQAPDACLGALATERQRVLVGELVAQLDLLLALPPNAPAELPASLLQGAWGLLARLTGEDRAESTLDALFSGFCLGK